MPIKGGNFERGQYVVPPMEYSVIPKPTHPRHIAPLQRPNLRDLRHIAPLCATYCPYDILPLFGKKGAICRRGNMSEGQYVMEPRRGQHHHTVRWG